MPLLVMIVFLGAAGAVAYVVLSRANELFCVSIRAGRCLVIRGRVPPKLWRELVTVVEQAKIVHGTVRAVKRDGAARLVMEGIEPRTQQRLRNALGSAGLSTMKFGTSEAREGSRNLGQLLGLTWLAWFLTRR